MPKYIFLDTNILSDYTKKDKFIALYDFVGRNDYTIIVNSLLLVELFNNGWEGGDDNERGVRVVRFLSSRHCVIVDPMKVWHDEFTALPDRLKRMPIELDLSHIPHVPRAQALLKFLRRDQEFLDMGKDIAEWANNYAEAKYGSVVSKGRDKDKGWLGDKQRIIDNACSQGYLRFEADGRYTMLERDQFLISLDLRLLPILGPEPSESEMNHYLRGQQQLRAVRLTSLAFLYKYIEYDPHAKPNDDGSDLGDIYFMSILPWCNVFTTDKNMLATVKRAAVEAKCTSCRILGRKDLDSELRRYKA
jgi:hypothetical protein